MAKKNNYQLDTTVDEGESVRPSRSQKKRDATALQDLGERLAALSPKALRTLPLSAEMVEAYTLLQRISSREGRRRQLQFIGRLMRDMDAEAIQNGLDALQQDDVRSKALFHQAERLRDALITDASGTRENITAMFAQEAEELFALAAEARRESSAQKPPAAARRLFQSLRGLLQEKQNSSEE